MELHAARRAKAELLWRLGAGGRTQHHEDAEGEPLEVDIAVGISFGRAGANVAVRVFGHRARDLDVAQRIVRDHSAASELTSRLDFRHVGRLVAYAGRGKGGAIGDLVRGENGQAGTVGAILELEAPNRVGLLSNNHVLLGSGRRGDPVYDATGTQIGSVDRFVPLERRGNLVDAAIAGMDNPAPPTPITVASPEECLGNRVWKRGAASGHTEGLVTAIEVDGVPVYYPYRGRVVFDNQIEVAGLSGPFTVLGDSGSTVWTADGRAVGLFFAGPSGNDDSLESYASPMATVLEEVGKVGGTAP